MSGRLVRGIDREFDASVGLALWGALAPASARGPCQIWQVHPFAGLGSMRTAHPAPSAADDGPAPRAHPEPSATAERGGASQLSLLELAIRLGVVFGS